MITRKYVFQKFIIFDIYRVEDIFGYRWFNKSLLLLFFFNIVCVVDLLKQNQKKNKIRSEKKKMGNTDMYLNESVDL